MWLHRCCRVLIAADVLLGLAPLLWPESRWVQERLSSFTQQHARAPASWFASMQLAATAGFAVLAFLRGRRARRHDGAGWVAIATATLLWSLTEMTRDPGHPGIAVLAQADPFGRLLGAALAAGGLGGLGWLVLAKVAALESSRRWAVTWLVLWGGALAIGVAASVVAPVSSPVNPVVGFATGGGFLAGATCLFAAIAGYALRAIPDDVAGVAARARASADRARAGQGEPGRGDRTAMPAEGSGDRGKSAAPRAWLLTGVFGTAFVVIVLQSLLLRVLGIFADYTTAHGVIAIALLGVAAGALIGYSVATGKSRLAAVTGASLLLPVSILTTYGAIAALGGASVPTALFLAVPFLLASVAITVVLVRGECQRVYCVDLLGAAAGALAVGPALDRFREEGSLLLLAAVAFLSAWAFSRAHAARRVRGAIGVVCLAGTALAGGLGVANLERDWFNLVREQVASRYPASAVLYSRSSLAGRYDVIRRWRDARSLSALENGWSIDTIRPSPVAAYRIDPRLPYNLIDEPVILILGLSGDGITKTARAIGKEVYGVEINPAVVALQTGALVEHNGASYDGIEVAVGDARTFVETSERRYDIITLLNAHAARGRGEGRAASPEYLHTREAIGTYLDHLSERGVVIVEEPVGSPWREVPVWKLLWTMRAALRAGGVADPARHFFVFQWRTPSNRYLQILMKKTPFGDDELARLRVWLGECERRAELEGAAGRSLGPITTVTTLLHAPDEPTGSNVSRLIRGDVDERFRRAHGLEVTTDDRPFHFDVDPAQVALRDVYRRTALVLVVVLLPLAAFSTRRAVVRRARMLVGALPYVQVAALTGIAYLLLEVALLQRYAIFLGSPLSTFATVVGTMLAGSGLGSLWSGRLAADRAARVVAAIVVLVAAQALVMPWLFATAAGLPPAGRVAIAVVGLAPLAVAMGVPFPHAMRAAQAGNGRSAAALLFAVNAAAGAIAVPLAMALATLWGLSAVLAIAAIAYVLVGALVSTREGGSLRAAINVVALVLTVELLALPVAPGVRLLPGAPAPSDAWTSDGALPWRVYAARYGESLMGAGRIFADGSADETRPFGWFFWIVRGGGRTILVDTGFEDIGQARVRGIGSYVQPSELLRTLGIDPDDVTDVILTHAHWDHMGGIGAYPEARIYIQDAEYTHAVGSVGEGRRRRHGIRWRDVRALRDAEADGRLVRLAGDAELIAGVRVVAAGGHTPGSQWVEVATADGTVVIAGDAVPQDDANAWRRAIAQSGDPAASLAAVRRMQRRAASPFLIVPGHDPVIEDWYPGVAPGVLEITAQPRPATAGVVGDVRIASQLRD